MSTVTARKSPGIARLAYFEVFQQEGIDLLGEKDYVQQSDMIV